MQTPIVKFLPDEKEKLISFLKEKAIYFKKRAVTMQKELKMLNSCLEAKPTSVTEKWLVDLNNRIKDYNSKITDLFKYEVHYNELVDGVVTNSTIEISNNVARDFNELYNREREVRKIDGKYKYYPRLKKAKEAALYVFSDKIKIFMEYKNVKIAA